MATTDKIAEVRGHLPGDADWTDEQIERKLDEFVGSVARVMLSYWQEVLAAENSARIAALSEARAAQRDAARQARERSAS